MPSNHYVESTSITCQHFGNSTTDFYSTMYSNTNYRTVFTEHHSHQNPSILFTQTTCITNCSTIITSPSLPKTPANELFV